MVITRRRLLIVHDAALAGVERAVIAAIDKHVPSERTIEHLGSTIRIAFRATIFGRGVTNWNVYLVIHRGHVDLIPDDAAPPGERGNIVVVSTLDVRRALATGAAHSCMVVIPLLINRLWVASAFAALFAMPTWAMLISEGYVGTFQRSLVKELDTLEDEPRRGFEVVAK